MKAYFLFRAGLKAAWDNFNAGPGRKLRFGSNLARSVGDTREGLTLRLSATERASFCPRNRNASRLAGHYLRGRGLNASEPAAPCLPRHRSTRLPALLSGKTKRFGIERMPQWRCLQANGSRRRTIRPKCYQMPARVAGRNNRYRRPKGGGMCAHPFNSGPLVFSLCLPSLFRAVAFYIDEYTPN